MDMWVVGEGGGARGVVKWVDKSAESGYLDG
jgi:hypothetical protein